MNEVFTQLYRDVLVDRCIIRIDWVEGNTYHLSTHHPPVIEIVSANWKPGLGDLEYLWRKEGKCHNRYVLSPGGPRFA